MDNIRNWGIGIVAVVALVLGIMGVSRTPQITVNPPFGGSGPDESASCMQRNGVRTCYYSVPLTTGTSTPAWIKSPSATTTAQISLSVASSSTSAVEWHISNNTVQYFGKGTTTDLNHINVAASGMGLLMSTTSSLLTTGLIDATIIPPNTYIVAGAENLGGSGFKPVGVLKVIFTEVQ